MSAVSVSHRIPACFSLHQTKQLLMDAGFSDYGGEVKQWYDGYRFGDVEVYCPWSVLNYLNDLQQGKISEPKNYWVNTSHNGIIYRFISRADLHVNDKFETLMTGGSVATKVEENLTYDTINSSEENLWSLLYLTGYLTGVKSEDADTPLEKGTMALKIPNEEVKSVFDKTIMEWFHNSMATENRHDLFQAFWRGTRKRRRILFRTCCLIRSAISTIRKAAITPFL